MAVWMFPEVIYNTAQSTFIYSFVRFLTQIFMVMTNINQTNALSTLFVL